MSRSFDDRRPGPYVGGMPTHPAERPESGLAAGARLMRAALLQSGYDAEWLATAELASAMAAYDRGWPEPLREAMASVSAPRAVWGRLFLLGEEVAVAEAGAVGIPLAAAGELGLVTWREEGATVRASRCLRPLAPDEVLGSGGEAATGEARWWTVSGLPVAIVGDELPADHVVGVGGASRSLAALTPREPVGRALDIGTGCGVQVLGLAAHAAHVVASDVSPTALDCAELTCRLSGVESPELVSGSLLEPVTGEFDLIVANPPFVMAPPETRAGPGGFSYRDSPMHGDGLVGVLLESAAARLTPGGTLVMTGAWLHGGEDEWQQRVAGWLPSGLAVWVGQRAVLSVPEYVELWLRDSGATEHLEERYRQWLRYLRSQQAQGVGFGFVAVRRPPASAGQAGASLIEDLGSARRLPDGAEVSEQLDRLVRPINAAEMLASVVRPSSGVLVADRRVIGDDGTSYPVPASISRPAGFRAEELLDSPVGWLLAEDQPGRPMGQLLARCSEELAEDPEDVLVSWLMGVRDLMEKGFVTLDPLR